MKSSFLIESIKIVIIALLIVAPIRMFLFQPFIVRGVSMEPSFYEGDYLLIDQLSYRFSEPERGDVVIFQYPGDPNRRYIKRIIGLPGEEVLIQEKGIYITSNGEKEQLVEDYLSFSESYEETEVRLEADEYFVVGDNRGSSSDSRNWGALPRDNIMGRVFFQLSPFDSVFALVETPTY